MQEEPAALRQEWVPLVLAAAQLAVAGLLPVDFPPVAERRVLSLQADFLVRAQQMVRSSSRELPADFPLAAEWRV